MVVSERSEARAGEYPEVGGLQLNQETSELKIIRTETTTNETFLSPDKQ
jgi:hypothetical protein